VIESPALRTALVGVEALGEAIEVAQSMVEEGVQLIELCGWFGTLGTSEVIRVTKGRVPVGFLSPGAESTKDLYELLEE
jgi:hypothetical protein